mgnify:CR=1 FL=1|jgi:hypothetical protein
MDGWMDGWMGKGHVMCMDGRLAGCLVFCSGAHSFSFLKKQKAAQKNVWEGYRLHVMNENEEKDKTKWLRFFL